MFIAVLREEGLPLWMRVTDGVIFHTPTIMQCSVLWSEGLKTPEGRKARGRRPHLTPWKQAPLTHLPRQVVLRQLIGQCGAAVLGLAALGCEDDSHRGLLTCLQ